MKRKEHNNLIAGGVAMTGEVETPRWQPSAKVFFGLTPITSATTMMLRGRDQFVVEITHLSGDYPFVKHQ